MHLFDKPNAGSIPGRRGLYLASVGLCGDGSGVQNMVARMPGTVTAADVGRARQVLGRATPIPVTVTAGQFGHAVPATAAGG